MIEIIPNWHPIFVHFTVALFSTAVVFYSFDYLFKKLKFYPKLSADFEIVARWCLWTVSIIVIGTITTGLYAYYTVQHDTPSHLVMTNHRNWAIPTASAMLIVALWSAWQTYKRKAINGIFIFALLVVQVALLSTAWHGAELVFRYGVGVMSVPKSEVAGHHHQEQNKESKKDEHNVGQHKH